MLGGRRGCASSPSLLGRELATGRALGDGVRGVDVVLEWVDEKVVFRALGLEVCGCTWLKCWQRWMCGPWGKGDGALFGYTAGCRCF